jgi:uncharacterized protein
MPWTRFTTISPPRSSSPEIRAEETMALKHSDAIEVKQVKGKGRGVFARRVIREDEVIERVPVLVLPIEDIRNVDDWTHLASYCFNWGEGTVALALGYGSIYNHSFRPNAKYEDVGRQTKVFIALREIQFGEEITVNYNADPKDKTPVGFAVVETLARS